MIDLAQLRRETGVTQADLADRLGVKQAAVSKLERETDFLVSSLAKYLEALGADARITVTVNGREHEYELTNCDKDCMMTTALTQTEIAARRHARAVRFF